MGNSDYDTAYMRVGGDDGELRLWHYIYVYSIRGRLIMSNGALHIPTEQPPVPAKSAVT